MTPSSAAQAKLAATAAASACSCGAEVVVVQASFILRNTLQAQQGTARAACLSQRTRQECLQHLPGYTIHTAGSITQPTCDQRKALSAIEVHVLDGHDASVGKHLLRVVVDELAVAEAGDALVHDGLHLLLHLVALCPLQVCHLCSTYKPSAAMTLPACSNAKQMGSCCAQRGCDMALHVDPRMPAALLCVPQMKALSTTAWPAAECK